MQEAGDAIQIQLHAQYAVARRRLGEEPIGDLGLLHAAVIGPQAGHPVLDKGIDMIGRGDRGFHRALLIESETDSASKVRKPSSNGRSAAAARR